jgi:hypothetical protein
MKASIKPVLLKDRTMAMLWSEDNVSNSRYIARNGTASHEPAVEIEVACKKAVADICSLNWNSLTADELVDIAWIYYYFSVQFCENVGIARALNPHDKKLLELDLGERNTDNLSPYPGVVEEGEKVDHDDFMRRTLRLQPIDDARRRKLQAIGSAYLDKVRSMDAATRATSILSYEGGGLPRVFTAIRTAPHWDGPLQGAFKHFLDKHIELDGAEDGHGSLCSHLKLNGDVLELWLAFKNSMIAALPKLANPTA